MWTEHCSALDSLHKHFKLKALQQLTDSSPFHIQEALNIVLQ